MSKEVYAAGKMFKQEMCVELFILDIFFVDANMAKFHVAKLRREGNCNVPKPKIVLASNDPTKQYTPHCTILHRCGDDVGCCPQAKTCAASKNSTVELYFFVCSIRWKQMIQQHAWSNSISPNFRSKLLDQGQQLKGWVLSITPSVRASIGTSQ